MALAWRQPEWRNCPERENAERDGRRLVEKFYVSDGRAIDNRTTRRRNTNNVGHAMVVVVVAAATAAADAEVIPLLFDVGARVCGNRCAPVAPLVPRWRNTADVGRRQPTGPRSADMTTSPDKDETPVRGTRTTPDG